MPRFHKRSSIQSLHHSIVASDRKVHSHFLQDRFGLRWPCHPRYSRNTNRLWHQSSSSDWVKLLDCVYLEQWQCETNLKQIRKPRLYCRSAIACWLSSSWERRRQISLPTWFQDIRCGHARAVHQESKRRYNLFRRFRWRSSQLRGRPNHQLWLKTKFGWLDIAMCC